MKLSKGVVGMQFRYKKLKLTKGAFLWVIWVRISDLRPVWIMVHQRNRWVRSFGMIRVRISDPRSLWVMVHQRDSAVPLMHHDPDRSLITDLNSDHPKRTHSPVPLMHQYPDRSWITDPNSDHPKGTHPNFVWTCYILLFLCTWFIQVHIICILPC